MIRDLKLLGGGHYVGDFRIDEGIRIREEYISPTLTRQEYRGVGSDNCITGMVLLVEIREKCQTNKGT